MEEKNSILPLKPPLSREEIIRKYAEFYRNELG